MEDWRLSDLSCDDYDCRRRFLSAVKAASRPDDHASIRRSVVEQRIPAAADRYHNKRLVIVWKRKKTSVIRRKAKDGVTDGSKGLVQLQFVMFS